MADTYTLIEKITVGAAGATAIEFTSIPQTYTDLIIKLSARSTGGFVSNAVDSAIIYFNTDTSSTTNYSARTLSSGAGTPSSDTTKRGGLVNGSSTTASTFANSEYYIPNYTGSSNKSVSIDSATENNSTAAYANLQAWLWSNTAAITAITLKLESGSNFVQYSTAYLYGIAKEGVSPAPSSAPYATGGDSILFDGTYWIHTFRTSGTFTPKKNLSCDYLVVAGGGGGGSVKSFITDGAPGGGAGGLRSTVTATGGGGSLESALSLTANTGYTVTIGAGGAGGANDNTGSDGSNSVFSTITSTGGGGGGGFSAGTGRNGGSGGGGSYDTVSRNGGTGTANQGYAGGNAEASTGAGGGGGGAGAVGQIGQSGANGANGGIGVAVAISGTSTYYAGGGGGGSDATSGTAGAGGTGGGGNGFAASTTNAQSGTANTGGGGGGGGAPDAYSTGGAGGSGIVIVRYAA